WQGAAAGTPDPGAADDHATTCATTGALVDTGSRPSCKSLWGAVGLIGNGGEWVAHWGGRSRACTNWAPDFGAGSRRLGRTRDPGDRRRDERHVEPPGRLLSRRERHRRHGCRRLRGRVRCRSLAAELVDRVPVRPVADA